MFAVMAPVAGSPRHGGFEEIGAAGEIVLAVEDQGVGAFIGQDVLAEFGAKLR